MDQLQVCIILNSHPDQSEFWDSPSGQAVLAVAKEHNLQRSVSNPYAAQVEREAMGTDINDLDFYPCRHEDAPSLQSADLWGTGEGQYHGLI